jgi:hypothetical protein
VGAAGGCYISVAKSQLRNALLDIRNNYLPLPTGDYIVSRKTNTTQKKKKKKKTLNAQMTIFAYEYLA